MTPRVKDLSSFPVYWGLMLTAASRCRKVPPGRAWCADNGVYTGKFEADTFWRFLRQMEPFRSTCQFITAPDVVGNALATMDAFRYWGPRLKEAGWPVAFVAQDGQEIFPLPPTTEYDALFVGGSTDWKLSPAADSCIKRARADRKWVHAGRVNSQKRIAHFQVVGVDSVDGTGIAIAPDKNFIVLDKQLAMRPLFTIYEFDMYIVLYLVAIVLANLSVATFGPSVTILNAFLLIGLDLTARDRLHDAWHGRGLVPKMAALIAAGSLLSWLLNRDAGTIALASFVAFAAAATVDSIVYHLLGNYPRWLRINGSNIPSAAVDSLIFPTIAFGGFLWPIVLGQFLAKALGGFFWSLVLRWREGRHVAVGPA